MITLGLRYPVGDVQLHGYTDVDWVGNVVDRKNMYGCCFSLGYSRISWMRRKKNCVALKQSIFPLAWLVPKQFG